MSWSTRLGLVIGASMLLAGLAAGAGSAPALAG
jgi:hypothetical protein